MAARAPVLFRDEDTVLHRRDPRVKMGLFLLSFVLIFIAPSWPWMLLASGLGVATAAVARTPWKWLAVLWAINLPSFVVILATPLWSDAAVGDVLPDALYLVLAWTAAIFLSVGLFSTMDPREVTQGLRGLGAPKPAAVVVGLSYRLLHTALQDALQIGAAMRLKGLELETRNPVRLIAGGLRLILPILFAVLRRAPVLMASLALRGYAEADRGPARPLDAGDAALAIGALLIVAAAAADGLGAL